MTVIANAVRAADLDELLAVLLPLARANTSSAVDLRATLDRADAYAEKYADRHRYNRGTRSPTASRDDLLWSAHTSLHMLANVGIPAIRAAEPVVLPCAASILHAYARAITRNPNVAPVHRESTQCFDSYSWLDSWQVRNIAKLDLGLQVPVGWRLRAEWQRVGLPSQSDAELDDLVMGMAGSWIRVAQLLVFAAQHDHAYVAYDVPPETD